MTTTGVDTVDRSVEKAHVWINDVDEEFGTEDRRQAYRVLRAFKHTLRDHLSLDEAAELVAPGPILAPGVFYEGWDLSRTREHAHEPRHLPLQHRHRGRAVGRDRGFSCRHRGQPRRAPARFGCRGRQGAAPAPGALRGGVRPDAAPVRSGMVHTRMRIQPSCQTFCVSELVVDTETRRRAHVPIYTELPVPALVPSRVTVALSPKGAMAWLENSTRGASVISGLQLWATALNLHGRSSLAAAPRILDAGSIDPSSLRFDGRTLYWIRDGRQHHQVLGR